jgi:hypothetical protein
LTQPIQQNVELKLRTLRTLWLALFGSVGFYFVLTFFIGPSENVESNPTLSLILIVVGLSTTLISFVIKSKLIGRAIELQRIQMVQQAYMLTWAVTEVAGLLGFLDFLATGHRHYYILFIIAAIGFLLNAPRRDHLINAWPKTAI